MARLLGMVTMIVVFLASVVANAIASPVLFLGSASAKPGETTSIDLSISDDMGTNTATYAGMNARIVFDTDKVQVTGVSQGAGLSAGNFTVDYGTATVNGHSEATVIAYSANSTFGGSSGVLLKLNLKVDANATMGPHTVQFATTDVNPLINAKHAVSNEDGSVSMGHTTQDGSLSIGTGGFVDTDKDGIDDNWEIKNFGNLKTADATTDADKDGILDKDEYNNSSNPNLITPTVVSITPSSGKNTIVTTDLMGSNFQNGATAKLVKSGHSDIIAANVQVVSPTKISCEFSLTGAAVGTWDVQVMIPNGEKGMLFKGFTVNESSGSCTDDFEPNDDFNVAKGPLDADTDYQGKICEPTDKDYFQVTK
ncbi:MAG: cohesin domain-containing protein [Candidatus Brocadiaceae bacterium]